MQAQHTMASREQHMLRSTAAHLLSAYSFAASELAGDAGLGSLSSDCESGATVSKVSRGS
jgi:hypothetical protein